MCSRTPQQQPCVLQGVYGFPSTEEVPFAFAEIVKKQRPLMAFYERLKAQCFPEGTETQFDVKLP